MKNYISRINNETGKKEVLILDETTLLAVLQLTQNEEGKNILEVSIMDEHFLPVCSNKKKSLDENSRKLFKHATFEIDEQEKEQLESKFDLINSENKENVNIEEEIEKIKKKSLR